MTVLLRRQISLDEFLAWEERQEMRWEFDGFEPVAMTGGTVEHGVIRGNLNAALNTRLRGTPCRAVGSDVAIKASGSIRYPDLFVFCSEFPRGTRVVTEPVVVFEVLSPSTDIGPKNEEYRDTRSIQRYVMLAQDRQRATVFERIGDDWVGHIMSADAVLRMPEIGVEVPLAELYVDVRFPGTETNPEAEVASVPIG
jgi:Uma2 family endonuclease